MRFQNTIGLMAAMTGLLGSASAAAPFHRPRTGPGKRVLGPRNAGTGGGADRQRARLWAKAQANAAFYAAIPPASAYPLPKQREA